MSEASYDALIMIDSKGRTTFWNSAAEKMFGYRAEEVIGQDLHKYIALDNDRKEAAKGMPDFAKTGEGQVMGSVMEFTAKDKWENTFPVERSVSSFQLSGEWYAVGIIRDITKRKQIEEKLRRLATTDTLTKLPNRRHFLECLESDLNQAKRYKRPFSLIMLDIDHFKSVNDTYGHDSGDKVLETFAQICLETVRQTDTPGRIGGEEFAVVLPETDNKAAVILAKRLRKNIESATIGLPGGEEISITASIGVVSLTENDDSSDSLIKNADQALYEAKRKGRNRVEIGK
jgi:diguanylate cyclase (GGDEF)-like protein/PAS domain S-box-containing protein